MPDIDIDCKNRDNILEYFYHKKASIIKDNKISKHNTGVYFHDVPIDPLTNLCSIDYKEASNRGYFKIDLLNINVYNEIESEEHLNKLLNKTPLWEMLEEWEIVQNLFQINSPVTFNIIKKNPPKNINELAILIALIRPPMKHLVGKSYEEIEKHIWNIDEEQKRKGAFRKSHAYAYAHVVLIQMNLILEKLG